MAKNRLSLLV